jgi:hypothetical protein
MTVRAQKPSDAEKGRTKMDDREFLMDWLNESDLLLGKANQDYSSMTKPTGNQR